ncbi:helix-turn-helix transcriptional regulator [Pseudactinotalea sp. Z1732]|uniref:helix-turn-helix transcriptional regulator n=1 Tax=Micrococcales TaxID=85006 RepID=UPI003C7B49D5
MKDATSSAVGALPPPQAAEYLGVANATLKTWRCRGFGPVYAKIGRSVVYRVSDLDDYLEDHLVNKPRTTRSAA